MPMSRQEVVALMAGSQSAQEWNDNCAKVKAANNGMYPPYWYDDIIRSGLSRQVMGPQARVSITSFDSLDDLAAALMES